MERTYERHLNTITIKNIGSSKIDFYEFILPIESVSRLSSIKFETSNSTVLPHTAQEVSKSNKHQSFKIAVSLSKEEQTEFKARYVLLPSFQPKPFNSKIGDAQFFQYDFNIVYLSVYETFDQSLKIYLPSDRVESYTKYENVEHKGKEITYGPIKSIKPLYYIDGSVHFENKKTQLILQTVFRDVEISNWNDDIWIQETYDIRNLGPKIDSYSRIEHQMNKLMGKTNMVEQLKLQYKYPISKVYYRDQIGNVSTSNFYSSTTKANLYVKPRYPIYGQWKYQFHVGYHIKLSKLVKRTGDIYELNLEYLNSFKNIPIRQATTRIVLPEGAKLVRSSTELEGFQSKSYTHHTYFDYKGRVAVEISKKNAIDSQASKNIKIVYEYTLIDKLIKLRTFFVSICLLLILVSCSSRVIGGIKHSKLN